MSKRRKQFSEVTRVARDNKQQLLKVRDALLKGDRGTKTKPKTRALAQWHLAGFSEIKNGSDETERGEIGDPHLAHQSSK